MLRAGQKKVRGETDFLSSHEDVARKLETKRKQLLEALEVFVSKELRLYRRCGVTWPIR